MFLGWPRPRRSDAGTSIPTARNRLLRNGPELGEARFATTASFPGIWPDVHGPPSPVGFGMFRGLGRAAPSGSAAESAPRQPVRLADRLASLQGPSEPCARRRALRLPTVVRLEQRESFDAIVFPAGCLPASRTQTVMARHSRGPSAVASWADGGPGPKETGDENASLLACCSIPRRVPLASRSASRVSGRRSRAQSWQRSPLVVRGVRRLTPCFEFGVASEQGAAGDTNVGVWPCSAHRLARQLRRGLPASAHRALRSRKVKNWEGRVPSKIATRALARHQCRDQR